VTRGIAVVFGGGALIFASVGFSAATPISPPPGAIVTAAHPVFSWTLPANEQSQAISIANKPDVTPAGRFYDENLVDLGDFSTDVREWSPSTPLYAGRYWWNVLSTDRDTFASSYSAPVDFTIPVALTLRAIKTKRYLFIHSLSIDVRWSANARQARVTVRLFRAGKAIWKAAETDDNSIGFVGSTTFDWHRPRRVGQGARLTLRASISSASATQTRAIVVRAP
jgi:hypothetical protein